MGKSRRPTLEGLLTANNLHEIMMQHGIIMQRIAKEQNISPQQIQIDTTRSELPNNNEPIIEFHVYVNNALQEKRSFNLNHPEIDAKIIQAPNASIYSNPTLQQKPVTAKPQQSTQPNIAPHKPTVLKNQKNQVITPVYQAVNSKNKVKPKKYDAYEALLETLKKEGLNKFENNVFIAASKNKKTIDDLLQNPSEKNSHIQVVIYPSKKKGELNFALKGPRGIIKHDSIDFSKIATNQVIPTIKNGIQKWKKLLFNNVEPVVPDKRTSKTYGPFQSTEIKKPHQPIPVPPQHNEYKPYLFPLPPAPNVKLPPADVYQGAAIGKPAPLLLGASDDTYRAIPATAATGFSTHSLFPPFTENEKNKLNATVAIIKKYYSQKGENCEVTFTKREVNRMINYDFTIKASDGRSLTKTLNRPLIDSLLTNSSQNDLIFMFQRLPQLKK